MKSSKRVVKAVLSVALVLAMAVTTLFTSAGTSYAAGEAKLNKTSRNILTQRSFDFDVEGAPADAVITWKSSDDKVASVDADGVVTGIKKGDVKITCEITANGKTEKLTAAVKVCKPAVKLEISNKITELEYGKTYDLNRKLTPKTSNDVTTWKSSNTKIATVDKNGVVKALADGTVTITATTMSGRTDSVEITVFGAPEPTPVPGITEAPKVTSAPKPTSKPKPTSAPKNDAVYEESFEKNVGDWLGRGDASVSTKKSVSSPDGTQYMFITGRTANWHGGAISMNTLLELGGTYSLTAWVKQDSGDGEVIKATGQKNNAEYPNIGTAITNKGEWTEISGTITVDADTKDYLLYFEADNLIDICVDKVVIKEVSGGTSTIYTPPTSADGSLEFKAVDMTKGGWQHTVNASGGVDKVKYDQQYAEVQYQLAQPLTLGDYSGMAIKMSSTDMLGIKLLDASGQQIAFWWSKSSDSLAIVELDYAKMGYGENEAMSADALAQKVASIGVMAQNGACEATIESISFIPKK